MSTWGSLSAWEAMAMMIIAQTWCMATTGIPNTRALVAAEVHSPVVMNGLTDPLVPFALKPGWLSCVIVFGGEFKAEPPFSPNTLEYFFLNERHGPESAHALP